jgi:hypothetical protein
MTQAKQTPQPTKAPADPQLPELGAPPADYDGEDDFAKSILLGFETIRERMKNGGPGWTPK